MPAILVCADVSRAIATGGLALVVLWDLQRSEARERKQLRDEVTPLKRLVAGLSLDKVMLQDVIQETW